MPTYTKPTGSAGTMKIEDDGVEYVEFWLLGVNQLVDQIPWAYVVNGVESGWNAFRLEANVAWQKVATFRVVEGQTVTFKLGVSGNTRVGGPTDFSADITRVAEVSVGTGVVRIKVGDLYRYAIPYVNDNGVWKQADPWGRIAGLWNRAN